jgi:hypothetical protein
MAAQPSRALGEYNAWLRPVGNGYQYRSRAVAFRAQITFVLDFNAERWIKRQMQP